MGLGTYPSGDEQYLGMLGMHGTYEANHAMHDCDLMICVGARFDDRVTSEVNKFSPKSKKIHIDIEPATINKNVIVDVPIVGDCATVLEEMNKQWQGKKAQDLSECRITSYNVCYTKLLRSQPDPVPLTFEALDRHLVIP